MPMTPEDKEAIVEHVRELLDADNVIARFVRSVKDTMQPGDEHRTYAPGKGKRVYIEIPCNEDEYYLDELGLRRKTERHVVQEPTLRRLGRGGR